MLNHRSALREMGDDSIVGIVDLMTGEKDPRNLMLVFSILKVVMVEWDISNHAEVCVHIAGVYVQWLMETDSFRCGLQLLPDHIQTSSERSLRYYRAGPEESPAGVHLFDETLCTICYSISAGQTRFNLSECQERCT